ncbi:class I mannose-6-phosphate isomerase [Leptospira sp. 96542]|nr:class I mannose-6-phosphate isomerase [Leptospira sp. 96542]
MIEIPDILSFAPIYKDKIWGGRKFSSILDRNLPNGNIGESWEVSVYGKDVSEWIDPNGNAQKLTDTIEKNPEVVLGKGFKPELPLLVKLIDAKEKLSVQVHPDDSYANAYDPTANGKKECWYVLAADKSANLVVGFAKTTTKEEFKSLVKTNQCESILKSWIVKPGDVFLLNPGTIHAIGAGVVLLEVQQSSDSTYRVYDYGRLGDDGKPRDLHLEKALAVLNFKQTNGEEKQNKTLVHFQPYTRYLFTSNDKFRLESWEFDQAQNVNFIPISKPTCFGIVYVAEGTIYWKGGNRSFHKGETFFITAKGFDKNIECYVSPKTKLIFMTAGEENVNFM